MAHVLILSRRGSAEHRAWADEQTPVPPREPEGIVNAEGVRTRDGLTPNERWYQEHVATNARRGL